MADRTANTVFFNSINPDRISFRSNASAADTITLPYGQALAVFGMNPEDDDDVIPTATVSGSVITFALVDDAGTSITVDTDLIGEVLLVSQ